VAVELGAQPPLDRKARDAAISSRLLVQSG